MTHNLHPLFALLFCFCISPYYAQDTLLLMSGQKLSGTISDDTGANIFLDGLKKNGKSKEYKLYKTDVFSVTKSGQLETVLYSKDSLIGNDYSVDQMRYFLYGENDARTGFKTLPTMIGGFALGLAGSSFVTGRSPIGLALFPTVYSLGMQIPIISIRAETISNADYKRFETYKEGYNKVARSKKFIHSFISTFAGVAAGIVIVEATE